jgi:hypothetical protein
MMPKQPHLDASRLVRTAPDRGGALLPSAASDRYFDYCLEAYAPRRPWQGKARSENLLWHALIVGEAGDSLTAPLEAIQRSLGKDMTVWGVKWDGNRLFWELYFYDPRKEDAAARATTLSETLAPWIAVTPRVRESTPYMMVSLDLTRATGSAGRIDELNLYLTGQSEHAGRSYRVRGDGHIELENTYRFLRAKPESDAILALLKSSIFVDYSDPRVLSKVLIPELFACKKICVAKKRSCDAIYYSGITIEQLEWFLRRFAYPARLVEFVATHRERFEHLYFDVGIDYRQDPISGAITHPKSSYYGTL